jgi:hypothetical protein
MLDRYALHFAKAFTTLDAAKVMCLPIKIPEGERECTNREIAEAVAIGLDLVRLAYAACGITSVMPELDRIAILIGPNTFAPRLGISQAIVHLQSRIKDDLALLNFYRVAAEDFPLYGRNDLFGEAVAKKFKDASADILGAGNCLALGQGTASVFHLMRAMEVAVRKLSRSLKINVTWKTPWRVLTGAMDAKIKKMPEATEVQKRKREKWEAACTNLHHVGSVWRNSTMHPATSYTPSQARDVFNAVRVFMIVLAEL